MLSLLKKYKNAVIYAVTVCIATGLLVAGGLWARYTPEIGGEIDATLYETAVVTGITDIQDDTYELSGEGGSFSSRLIEFRALLRSGDLQGYTVTAYQQQDDLLAGGPKDVEVGDKVLISFMDSGDGTQEWLFLEYHRSDALIWLCVVFFALLIVFGLKKGVNTIVSLVFTVLAVFIVFVPSILSGKNIYLTAPLVCLFSIIVTLIIVSGANQKTLCAAAGCTGGLVVTGLLTLLMSSIMHLTGIVDEQAIFLTMMQSHIDMKAVIFGAILVGALGAVMDVAMSLSSSLWEVSEHMGERRSFGALVKSGLNIGRDIMGTMANTLILAYIGSSLSVVLLLVANENSMLSLFNREMIVVEVMQALVGSLGILSTIPITSLLASYIYTRGKKRAETEKRPKKA